MAAFFNRTAELAEIRRWFKKTKSLLMLAPRRIGKTMLLHKLLEQAEQYGFRAALCDVEGCSDEKQFFREICRGIEKSKGVSTLWDSFAARLGKVLRGAETAPANWQQWLVQIDYKEFAEALLAELNSGDKPWIVMVDEVPIFVLAMLNGGNSQRARDFLYWLRNLRQSYPKVLWLYTGSIGLDTVSRRENMESAFNDMQPYALPPFDAKSARAFLDSLAERDGFSFGRGAAAHALQRLGWLSPYYLEKLVDEVKPSDAKHNRATKKDVDSACEALLAGGKRLYWSAWREHLHNNFKDPERRLLLQVLVAVAQDAEGASLDTLLGKVSGTVADLDQRQLRYALDVLQSDGYLISDAERSRYAFRMELLRCWWLRYEV